MNDEEKPVINLRDLSLLLGHGDSVGVSKHCFIAEKVEMNFAVHSWIIKNMNKTNFSFCLKYMTRSDKISLPKPKFYHL